MRPRNSAALIPVLLCPCPPPPNLSPRSARPQDFTHLHLHTLYSLLDGAIRMGDLIKTVTAKGMKSVAVTDHGNMFGTIDFLLEGEDANHWHGRLYRRSEGHGGSLGARRAPSNNNM